MSGLSEEIGRIIKAPLSSPIGSELLSTIEAAGVLRAALKTNSFTDLMYEAIALDELKYAYLLAGEEYNLHDLLINASCRQSYDRLSIVLSFLGDKLAQHNLILATDLLRASEFIRTGKQTYLQDAAFSDICSTFAQQTNSLLEIAYNDCANQHWLIQIAVICCCLGFNKNIEPLALYALCFVLINRDGTLPKLPLSICKYFLLEEPFEGQIYQSNGEQSIKAFLRHLNHTFKNQTILLHDIKSESESLYEKIREIIPRDSVSAIEYILQTKLSFTGAEIQNSTHATYRTALRCIHRLKNGEIIDSVRLGKENMYINIHILSKIERGLSDGAKKS